MKINLDDFLADESFYDAIRTMVGIADGEVLTNEQIGNYIFVELAIEIIEALLPCLYDEDWTEQQLRKIKGAFALILASLLAPGLTGMVEYEVKTIDVTWKRKPVDYQKMADDLLAKAKELLSGFECFTDNFTGNLFVVAPSKRAVNECER